MKLAVTTMCWGKLRNEKELSEVFRRAKEIGYKGIGLEFRLLPREILKRPERLSQMLRDEGLENAGGYFALRDEELELAKKSNTKILWIVSREKDCETAAHKIEQYLKKGSEMGISVILHNHLRTCFETEDEIVKILTRIPNLGLCLDTAHATAAGINMVRFIKEYSERIKLVHLKDLRQRLPKSRIRFGRDFVNVGEGIVNFTEILSSLKDVGYNGYLMLEIDKTERNKADQEVRRGYDYIQAIIRKI